MINVKNFQETRQEKGDTLFAIHHMELSFSERGLGLFRNVFCHEVTQLLSYHYRNLSIYEIFHEQFKSQEQSTIQSHLLSQTKT